jgi:hypothetical protein
MAGVGDYTMLDVGAPVDWLLKGFFKKTKALENTTILRRG